MSDLFEPYKDRPTQSKAAPLAVTIRSAQFDDAAAIARLTADRDGENFADLLSRIESQLTSPHFGKKYMILVAEHSQTVVGFGRINYFEGGQGVEFNSAPSGWYLGGIIVIPELRGHGIGHALTLARLRWVAERADEVFYFVNALNQVSIALHDQFGFVEVTREFYYPRVSFTGGEGILFRLNDLNKYLL